VIINATKPAVDKINRILQKTKEIEVVSAVMGDIDGRAYHEIVVPVTYSQ
jgi:hypothetical protein